MTLLTPRLLVGSSRLVLTQALARTHAGRSPSLLSLPAYRAATEALLRSSAAPERLIQAVFVHPNSVPPTVDSVVRIWMHRANPDAMEAMRAELTDGKTLTSYRLAVLADGHDGDGQMALALVVFDSAAQAHRARPIFEHRLDQHRDFHVDKEQTTLSEVEGRRDRTLVFEAYEMAVLVVPVRYPAPPKVVAGRLYQSWFKAVIEYRFLPLVPNEGD